MRRLNILFSASVRWWNASAYYTLSLAEALAERGHCVVVAGIEGSPLLEKAQQKGLCVESRLRLDRWTPAWLFRNLRGMRDLLEAYSIDLVNAHRAEDHGYWALGILCRKAKVPLVRTVNDTRPVKAHLLNRWLHRRLTDHCIMSAEAIRQRYLEKDMVPPERASVVYCGMDLDAFDRPVARGVLRREIGVDAKTPLIGIVGRLSPEKGHRFFIEAAAYVAAQRPDVHFVIAGEEAQIRAHELRAIARALHLEDCLHLSGRWNDIRLVITDLDIGVIASIYSEAVCRIAMEYMAMAKPIVGTAVNVIPEMMDHQHTGWVVPPRNSVAMAEAILTLLCDRDKGKAWGVAGRRKAERAYSRPKFAAQTEQVFLRALACNRRA